MFRLAGDDAANIEGRSGDRVHDAMHAARATSAKHIQFVRHLSYVVAPCWNLGRDFLGVKSAACCPRRTEGGSIIRRLCIAYYKLCAKKV